MLNRRLFPLSLLALAAGCAAPAVVRPPPPPAPAAAPTPAGLSQRVRREGWMTRFWEQLTPAQRRRVLARLRQGAQPAPATETEAAVVWDALGLPERDTLIFGPVPQPRSRAASTEAASRG